MHFRDARKPPLPRRPGANNSARSNPGLQPYVEGAKQIFAKRTFNGFVKKRRPSEGRKRSCENGCVPPRSGHSHVTLGRLLALREQPLAFTRDGEGSV